MHTVKSYTSNVRTVPTTYSNITLELVVLCFKFSIKLSLEITNSNS